MSIRSFLIVISFLLATLSGDTSALDSDRDQLVEIQADGAEINEKTGTSIYRGKVSIDQGTMQILADEIEIHTNGSEVIQIVARMNDGSDELAHYEQQPEAAQELIYADAREINYMIQEQVIHFMGKARLHQQANEFTGELVRYDIPMGVVNVHGGTADNNQPGRIKMIINPKKP